MKELLARTRQKNGQDRSRGGRGTMKKWSGQVDGQPGQCGADQGGYWTRSWPKYLECLIPKLKWGVLAVSDCKERQGRTMCYEISLH